MTTSEVEQPDLIKSVRCTDHDLVHRRRQEIQAQRPPSQAESGLSLNRLNASVH
jgi:hypothetical protein